MERFHLLEITLTFALPWCLLDIIRITINYEKIKETFKGEKLKHLK